MKAMTSQKLVGLSNLLYSFTFALVLTTSAYCQTKLEDPEAYRRAKAAATQTFLDKGQPKAERLAAVSQLGYPENETFERLLQILTDKAEDDDIRWAAAQKHRFDENYLTAALRILEDPNDGGVGLRAHLIEDINRRVTFGLDANTRQEIQRIFRKLLDDPNEQIRVSAYRALASSHDPVAVQKLSDALRTPQNAPIPVVEAINLLDLNGPVHHIVVLRPFLNSRDSSIQAAAARALAVDPESRPKIISLLNDRNSEERVKLAALRGLSREDSNFPNYGVKVLQKKDESGTIRMAAMRSLVGRMNYEDVPAKQQVEIAKAIEVISKDKGLFSDPGASNAAVTEAEKTLVRLKEQFPSVKEYYEKRR